MLDIGLESALLRIEHHDKWMGRDGGIWCERGGADLCAIAGNVVEDSAVRAVAKAAVLPLFWIIFIAFVESLRSEIKGIAKGLVNGLQGVSTCHKHLGMSVLVMAKQQ